MNSDHTFLDLLDESAPIEVEAIPPNPIPVNSIPDPFDLPPNVDPLSSSAKQEVVIIGEIKMKDKDESGEEEMDIGDLDLEDFKG